MWPKTRSFKKGAKTKRRKNMSQTSINPLCRCDILSPNIVTLKGEIYLDFKLHINVPSIL